MENAAAAPSSSRNCLDDQMEDEIAERLTSNPQPKYELKVLEQEYNSTALIVIGIGVAGAGFARACFPSAVPIGRMMFDSGLSVIPKRETKCVVSEAKTPESMSIILVECLEPVPEESTFDFMEHIITQFSPKQAVIFDTVLTSQYQLEGRTMHPPLLRCLDSSALRSSPIYATIDRPSLENGNIVQGLCAAAINSCEVNGIPARAVISLRESQLGSETVTAFLESLPYLSTCPVQGCIADREQIEKQCLGVRESVSEAVQDIFS